MENASILSIGNEVISGLTLDTNAAWLSRELMAAGVSVVTSYTVGDDVKMISRAIGLAAQDADIVLITGGLGPTDDDLTRQAIAEYLGTELEMRSDLLEHIESFFARRGLKMADKNRVQALLPVGTEPIENPVGTAPGIAAEHEGKLFFSMPGVPVEMEKMFDRSVLPRIKAVANGQAVVAKKLNCFGIGESNIAEILGPLMQRNRNPLINCTAGKGVITLHIIAKAKDIKQAEKLADDDEKMLKKMLGDIVFGTGDQTISEVLGAKLAQAGKTLAVAESCTGGLISKLLTDIPGSSAYFTSGWVIYSNDAKNRELAVPADIIDRYGAVSEQVAGEMAKAARKKAEADFAIAVTGIAGPTGATEQKPLGLVYIALDSSDGCEVKRYIFSHERSFMRYRTAQTALNMLRLKLLV